MNIEQFRQSKKELEEAMRLAANKFTQDTGLNVDSVDIIALDRLGLPRSYLFNATISLS